MQECDDSLYECARCGLLASQDRIALIAVDAIDAAATRPNARVRKAIAVLRGELAALPAWQGGDEARSDLHDAAIEALLPPGATVTLVERGACWIKIQYTDPGPQEA